MKKINKKIIAILMLISIILGVMQNIVFAQTEISSAHIEDLGDCGRHLQYFKSETGKWSYVITSMVGYKYNGKTHYAYCLEIDKKGAEKVNSYTVNISEILSDVRIWRTIINGFPYKTPEELGVENEYDAFVATKQAVYSVLYNRDVYTYYRGGDERGEKIVNAIAKMVDEGRNGTVTPQTANVTINKIGEIKEEGQYYSQEFSVSSAVNIDSYIITSTTGLPDGAKITDINNDTKNSFHETEHFKVLIPKDKLNIDIQSKISVQAKCETYPIFYGIAPNSEFQNYALTYDTLEDETGVATFNLKTNTGKIVINKTDSETNQPISGVTFQLAKEDGTVIANATTNENGVATFSALYQGKYILKEISTDDKYILNEQQFCVDVKYNETTKLDIKNEYKKGDLKIYKVDKDNSKVVLGGVEFDLYSEEFNKVIGSYKTNENGEIIINNLRIGNYKLIEKNTNKWYNLAEDTEIKVEWNNVTSTTIQNELKKGQVKVIKVDKDNNEVKLAGVTFEVLDENNNVLEKIVTDENGEALTSRYPIRDFKKLIIREVKILENYAITEETKTVVLKQEQIENIIFENERIKGNISITKYSSNDNKYSGQSKGERLEGAEFEIYDSENNLVDTIKTNEKGVAISKELLKGKYTIKETKAPLYYLVNENTFETEITNHKQTVNTDITDESVDIKVEVEKTGFIETQCNDTIYYDFKNIKNNSNVYLDTFNWQDSLPTNALRLERIFTGTWNQDLTYSVWYKTNMNDYKIIKDNLNTNTNYEINFEDIELQEGEYVTDYEFRFGKVDIGFQEVETPRIYCKVLQDLANGFKFTNTTKVYGTYFEKYVETEDEWSTIIYNKDIQLTKLPQTGY